VDGSTFDRIVKSLAGLAPRRGALKVAVVAGASGAASRHGLAETVARKRRCRRRGQKCGGRKKCCNRSGLVRCREFPVLDCKDISGLRCCGLEGASCDPDFGTPAGPSPTSFGNCSCCGPLFCGKQVDGSFRCQTEDT
jgi:hypothetical protein